MKRGRLSTDPEVLARLRSTWSSYRGHFQHANCRRLLARFHQRFPWLQEIA